MNRDDIIRMAREAGIEHLEHVEEMRSPMSDGVWLEDLEHFAALVAAHTLANIDPSKFMSYQEALEAGRLAEREQCAKVCDSLEEQCEKLLVPDEKWPTPSDCAHIIRARGNT